MIDPEKITNFDRTDSELEELMLFAVCVAGKNARIQAEKLDTFLSNIKLMGITPFQYIQRLEIKGLLLSELQKSKLGKYKLLEQSFKYLASQFQNELHAATIEELQDAPGVGMKTARFFVLHSRPNSRVAVIDTHLLKYLKREFPNENVPKVTPQQISAYRRMERLFLQKCDEEGVAPHQGDLTCWLTKGERISREKSPQTC